MWWCWWYCEVFVFAGYVIIATGSGPNVAISGTSYNNNNSNKQQQLKYEVKAWQPPQSSSSSLTRHNNWFILQTTAAATASGDNTAELPLNYYAYNPYNESELEDIGNYQQVEEKETNKRHHPAHSSHWQWNHPISPPPLRPPSKVTDESESVELLNADEDVDTHSHITGTFPTLRNIINFLTTADSNESSKDDDDVSSSMQDIHQGRRVMSPVRSESRKIRKWKRKFRKLIFPLLIAYKLKFLTLIPVLIGGLTLLVGTTGLAGFFFALFTAVMSLKGTGHSRGKSIVLNKI